MYFFFKKLLLRFSSSILQLIGNLLYNFYILYYSSSFKNTNFLYFITVLTTVSSVIYTVENIFQYHYGRLLFLFKDSNGIRQKESGIRINQIEASISFFYFNIILFVSLIFMLISFYFDNFYDILIFFSVSCLLNVASGFFSLRLISRNELNKLNLSNGLIKIVLFALSLLLYNFTKKNPIIFFLILLVFSIINLFVQKELSLLNRIYVYNISNIKKQTKNFFHISGTPLKQMIISLIVFFELKIYIIVGSSYMSKDIINSASLIQGLFSISLMLGGMYTVLNMNLFSSSNNEIKLSLYKKSLLFSLVIYFISLFSIYLFNLFAIEYFNYSKLPTSSFIIISIVYFFETILGIALTIYLYMQQIVYFKSYLLTACLFLLTYVFIYFNHFYLNPTTFMLLPLLFQLLYNYWYYPRKLFSDLNINNEPSKN